MDQRIIVTTPEDLSELIRGCIDEALKDFDPTKKPMEESEFIFIEDVMALTGYSKSTIYKLSCTDKIPHIRKHRRLLFRRSEILAWLEGGRRGPTTE